MFLISFLLCVLFFLSIIIGLFKPNIVVKWGKEENRTRGKVLKIYGLLFVVTFILFVVSAPEMTPEEKEAYQAQQKVKAEKKAEEKKAKEEAKAIEIANKEAEAKKKAEKKAEEEKAKEEAKAKEIANKEAEAKKKAEEKAAQEAESKRLAEEKAEQEEQAKREMEEKAAQNAIAKQNEFINSSIQVDYISLARNPDAYKSSNVFFTGKIVQTMESGKDVVLLVSVTKDQYGFWDDNIMVNYSLPSGHGRLLENDIINLWGMVKGLVSYESVLGQEITIPEMDGVYIELLGNQP